MAGVSAGLAWSPALQGQPNPELSLSHLGKTAALLGKEMPVPALPGLGCQVQEDGGHWHPHPRPAGQASAGNWQEKSSPPLDLHFSMFWRVLGACRAREFFGAWDKTFVRWLWGWK